MTPSKHLHRLNTLMDELHFDLANIAEEIIDGQNEEAISIANELIEKLQDLQLNLSEDEI